MTEEEFNKILDTNPTAIRLLAEFERVQRLSKVQNGSYAYVKTWFLNRYKDVFQQEDETCEDVT